ncbi:MAG: DUF1992 domain-containing protein [Chloroflexi bacterium]|nr:DUF1992 domain-containing protein [Chloroflexota bacterium]
MTERKSLIDLLLEEAKKRGIYHPTQKVERPLDLEDDALVPPEDRAGYRMLKSNGFAPPFIEERVQLLQDQARIRQERNQLLEVWPTLSDARKRERRAHLHKQYEDVWRRTLDFNLQAPLALHVEGVRVEYELRDFVITINDG